mmetsp:Transcript_73578/g.119410  ORF Transcript_73578/g.119410 Transcript_73578/m.119410 type:complete len:326 (+) Transcript_73578:25-1002(+)
MKFGKHIKTVAYPPWADKYVDYKMLKKCLKPFEDGVATQAHEDGFLACVLVEINKVDAFFNEKEAEFLQLQVGYTIKVEDTKAGPCNRTCRTCEDLMNEYQGTEMGEVIKDFMTFTAGVETLRHFAMLNLQAVIKITKKHDKHSDVTLQSDLVQQVHNRNFFTSQKFGLLIVDIEVLAMRLMSRLIGDYHGTGVAGCSTKNMQCPTCLEQLCNPICLPCGHQFCMKCVSIASYFAKGYTCPVCHQEHILDEETVNLIVNPTLLDFMHFFGMEHISSPSHSGQESQDCVQVCGFPTLLEARYPYATQHDPRLHEILELLQQGERSQ